MSYCLSRIFDGHATVLSPDRAEHYGFVRRRWYGCDYWEARLDRPAGDYPYQRDVIRFPLRCQAAAHVASEARRLGLTKPAQKSHLTA
jgi:hypothetical protein